MKTKNIFNIEYHNSFTDDLVKGIFERFGKDSFILSKIKIFLPNRRSCLALREAFLRNCDNNAMLLPSIKPISGIGFEDTILFEQTNKELLDLPPVVSDFESKIILTKLIYKWQCSKDNKSVGNYSQAAQLSGELKNLLELTHQHKVDLRDIAEIVPADLANHWQSTLEFLNIIINNWPAILEDQGLINSYDYQEKVLSVFTKSLQSKSPEYPIIVAGSTGSTPFIADFIKSISDIDNCYIILSGLDTRTDPEIIDSQSPTHPQYYLNKLINHLQIDYTNVKRWIESEKENIIKSDLIRNIMLPSNLTARWQEFREKPIKIDNLTIIETDNSFEEAKAIALILKETLQTPKKTACVVTQDRELAKQISFNMQKWDILINDSSGVELKNTPVANFFKLIAQMAKSRFAPIDFLSCLKHPLASMGLKPGQVKPIVREIELKILRGVRPQNFLFELEKIAPEWFCQIIQSGEKFASSLNSKDASLEEIIQNHIEFAYKIAKTDQDLAEINLWGRDYGEQFKNWFDDFLNHASYLEDFHPSSYLGVFDAFLSGIKWRPKYGFHPRVSILTPMEARLQHFDVVILGGMNEGVWPQNINPDYWLNNSIREKLDLPNIQSDIGKSAHDFAKLFCFPNVYISRAEKSGTSHNIASRWLLKLDAILKISNSTNYVKPKQDWTNWASVLENPSNIEYSQPPCPKPAVKYRPKKLSVSTISKLMRNPYDVYASKILKLKPLDKIDQDPNNADFGNIVHDILDIYNKGHSLSANFDQNYQTLINIGNDRFSQKSIPDSLRLMWWLKFESLAKWFVEEDSERRKIVSKIYSEITGELIIDDYTITAKADRIEIMKNSNTAQIIDYKTGSIPSKKDIVNGFAPQLSIEAIMLDNNAFGVPTKTQLIEYWKLNKDSKINGFSSNLEELLNSTEQGIKKLINTFNKESTPYLYKPTSYNDSYDTEYDHLSRVNSN